MSIGFAICGAYALFDKGGRTEEDQELNAWRLTTARDGPGLNTA